MLEALREVCESSKRNRDANCVYFVCNCVYAFVKDLKLFPQSSFSSLCLWRYQEEIDIYSSRLESDERGRGRERGRDRREKFRDSENGRSSRRQSTTSLHTQVWAKVITADGEIHIKPKISCNCSFSRVQKIQVENTDLQRWRSETLLNTCRHRWAQSHDVLHLYLSHECLKENGSYIHSKLAQRYSGCLQYFSFFTSRNTYTEATCSKKTNSEFMCHVHVIHPIY